MRKRNHNLKRSRGAGLAEAARLSLSRARLPARPLLGLDIGSFAIRIVVLRRRGGAPQVERIAALPLAAADESAASTVSDGGDGAVALEAVARDCRRACELGGITRRRAAVAVPYARTVVLDTTAPLRLRGAALERALLAEVASQLPEPPSLRTLCLDYERVPSSVAAAAAPGQARVTLVLCRNEAVEDLRAVLDGCGLQLLIADVDLFALERSLLPQAAPVADGGATALLDLGHSGMRLALLVNDNGRARVCRRHQHPFGGAQLVLALSRHYDCSESEARRRLWRDRDDAGDEAGNTGIVADFVARLGSEVAQAVAACDAGVPVTRLIAGGGCALLPGALEALAAESGVAVEAARPCACAGVAHGAAFAVAAGLALRGMGDASH